MHKVVSKDSLIKQLDAWVAERFIISRQKIDYVNKQSSSGMIEYLNS